MLEFLIRYYSIIKKIKSDIRKIKSKRIFKKISSIELFSTVQSFEEKKSENLTDFLLFHYFLHVRNFVRNFYKNQ